MNCLEPILGRVKPAILFKLCFAAREESMLAKVISRGRPGTAMPALGNDEGGPLKKFEVADVIAFIRNWDQPLLDAAAANLTAKSTDSADTSAHASAAASKAAAPGGDGETVFNNMGCAACHGDKGQGNSGPSLKGKSAAAIKKVVRSGGKTMPAFDAASLSNADLDKVIAFLTKK